MALPALTCLLVFSSSAGLDIGFFCLVPLEGVERVCVPKFSGFSVFLTISDYFLTILIHAPRTTWSLVHELVISFAYNSSPSNFSSSGSSLLSSYEIYIV